ncbi:MAG: glutamate synthase large subunit [Parvularcula sp.]
MKNYSDDYRQRRQRLIDVGAMGASDDRDACGVGFVAALDGQPQRRIVSMAIEALKAVWHRGAVDADGKTGDGAGLRLDIPQGAFREFVERTGHIAGEEEICVGMIFLPRTDFQAQDHARSLVESEILKEGLYIYGWRQVPQNINVLGEKAKSTRPDIEQVMFCDRSGRSIEEISRTLYLVRRRIEKRAMEEGLSELYICSLSARDIVYKGMFLAQDLDNFYTDFTNPKFISRIAIFHQRYSTNTFPEWRLAQPFRMLAHNGEINTLKGNINWMKCHEIDMSADVFGDNDEDVRPVVRPGSSDSAALDQVFELITQAGRPAPVAKSLLIPEAWSKRQATMPPHRRAFYEYCNAVMEPWDGPAAIAAYDGQWAVAGLDRNGLRPLRYAITDDGILAVGSEAGMCPLDNTGIRKKGAVEPGRMIAVDLDAGEFYESDRLIDRISSKHPYTEWAKNIVNLGEEIDTGEEPRLYAGAELARRQTGAAFTRETLELVLAPMATSGNEPIGSMGDDTPLAVLSKKYRPLADYFRQNFSQVTNPPIDPLRESRVMSLNTRFKNLGNILTSNETQSEVFLLQSPVLTNGMFDRLQKRLGRDAVEIDCAYEAPSSLTDGEALKAALYEIRDASLSAAAEGAGQVILTDEYQSPSKIAVPMILAVGIVHAALTRAGHRARCSIIVRSAECVDTHYMAVLIGVGATVVNPYVALESIAAAQGRGLYGSHSLATCVKNYKAAQEAGLLKIISKMGISVISSYRGGCNFDALGLSRALVEEFFPGMTSRISGIGLAGLEAMAATLHQTAWQGGAAPLPVGGKFRQRKSGEQHTLDASLISTLQDAVRRDDPSRYWKYTDALAAQPPSQLRDLLDIKPLGKEISTGNVESADSIRRRFLTPGMSLGALSPEAHGVLNIAMNRIGARSVSGEGGEDPQRYKPLQDGDNANSAIKQVASGRFGVTADYLNQCREIEIKVAQGAKPGEGGQLPGFKVTEFIARMRHATPGMPLISPPPHHDIYSIEDLAQLIYDLKQINPVARVAVKLVSASGIGAIAAGVAKAKADIIHISGHSGGTGAAALTSIKGAGGPWELGLAEAHQVLSLNNLRRNVTLRTDGGIRSGRDIVKAAMLGAEEFGIGTISLVALGCLMVRQCHSNACPVGICTQDEALREHFHGAADHIINLMTFLAEDTRRTLAELGVSRFDDIVGRTEYLSQVSRGAAHLDDLDLNPILTSVTDDAGPIKGSQTRRTEIDDTLDQRIRPNLDRFFQRGEKLQLNTVIKNTDRAIGARISSEIVRTLDPNKLPDDHLTLRLSGSAGQSLGAFSVRGLRIIVEGEANDYVGKGLSGAQLFIRPQIVREGPDAIIGNTCLYGATSGMLLAAGTAGGRFAVRNSGATAVIEGCLTNGCEYMTGGTVVVLGTIGDNFGAGMTGGEAFILDEQGDCSIRLNTDSVAAHSFREDDAERRCFELIERHLRETRSAKARRILSDWDAYRGLFRHVLPLDRTASKSDHNDAPRERML